MGPDPGGSYKGFRYFSMSVPGSDRERRPVPLVWSGASFVAEVRVDVTPGCLYCSRDGRTHRGTFFFSISGAVDVATRTLASLHVSSRREDVYPAECKFGKIAARFGLTDRSLYEEEASAAGLPLVPLPTGLGEGYVTFGVEGPATGNHVTAVRRKWAGAHPEMVGAGTFTQKNELLRVDWQSTSPRPSLKVYFQP